MPERHRINDPDYLRFRPYRAFTSPATDRSGPAGRRRLIGWAAGAVGTSSLVGLGLFLLHRR